MKRVGQALLGAVFALLLLWSCQALVEKPEASENPVKLPPAPIRAVLTAATADNPVQARAAEAEETHALRRSLPVRQAASRPVNAPVRDRNGIPLSGRSYIRTVYTACRLEETSG